MQRSASFFFVFFEKNKERERRNFLKRLKISFKNLKRNIFEFLFFIDKIEKNEK